VLTVVGAIPLFGQWPSSWFLAGVASVLLSVSMYSGAGPGLPAPLAAGLAAVAKAHPGLARAAGDVATALGLAKPASGSHAHAPAGAARRAARIRVLAGTAVALALVIGAGVVSRHAAGGAGSGQPPAQVEEVGAALGRRAGFGVGTLGRRDLGAAVGNTAADVDASARPATIPGDSDGDLSWSGPVDGEAKGGGGRGGGAGRRATLSVLPDAGWDDPVSHTRATAAAWAQPAGKLRRRRRRR
jgi:hypothetical protein